MKNILQFNFVFLTLFFLQNGEFETCHGEIRCAGQYQHHLQGVTVDKDHIYWSFTTTLVKTDREGKLIQKVPVVNHHGDLCHADGKLYVAVNLGDFNNPEGEADSWVYEYLSKDLTLIAKHPSPEVFHGAGGMDARNGKFYVIGGLPPGIDTNFVYEYDSQFNFQKKHTIKSGNTLMGIQTACLHEGRWYFGCYGSPPTLLVTDSDFKMIGRYSYNCSLGIVGVQKGKFFSASGSCSKTKGCDGIIRLAIPDEMRGLKLLEE